MQIRRKMFGARRLSQGGCWGRGERGAVVQEVRSRATAPPRSASALNEVQQAVESMDGIFIRDAVRRVRNRLALQG